MKKKKTTKTSALPKNVSGSINISMQQCTVVTNLNLKWLSNNPYFPFDKLDGLWFVIYVKGNYHYDVKLYLCCCILCFLILPLKGTSFIIWFLKPVGEFLDCFWMGKMYPVYPQMEFWWKSQDVRWFPDFHSGFLPACSIWPLTPTDAIQICWWLIVQCSCLENPRDGGAWWAAVSGVAQSRTRLKQLSSSSSSIDLK